MQDVFPLDRKKLKPALEEASERSSQESVPVEPQLLKRVSDALAAFSLKPEMDREPCWFHSVLLMEPRPKLFKSFTPIPTCLRR